MCKAKFIPANMEAIGSSQRQDIRSVLQESSFWLLCCRRFQRGDLWAGAAR